MNRSGLVAEDTAALHERYVLTPWVAQRGREAAGDRPRRGVRSLRRARQTLSRFLGGIGGRQPRSRPRRRRPRHRRPGAAARVRAAEPRQRPAGRTRASDRRDRALGGGRARLLHDRRRRGERGRDQIRTHAHGAAQSDGGVPLVPWFGAGRRNADRREPPLAERTGPSRRGPILRAVSLSQPVSHARPARRDGARDRAPRRDRNLRGRRSDRRIAHRAGRRGERRDRLPRCLSQTRARRVRPPRHPVDLRRGDDRLRTHRRGLCRAAVRRDARHLHVREGRDVGIRAARGRGRARIARRTLRRDAAAQRAYVQRPPAGDGRGRSGSAGISRRAAFRARERDRGLAAHALRIAAATPRHRRRSPRRGRVLRARTRRRPRDPRAARRVAGKQDARGILQRPSRPRSVRLRSLQRRHRLPAADRYARKLDEGFAILDEALARLHAEAR